jgi:hypothetical protein
MTENIKELHDRDFNLWVEATKCAIQNRDFENMDWDNLIDEIEDMSASQKRALRSYAKRLIEHILKLKYWEQEFDRCSRGWQVEVSNFRSEVIDILADSPSLNNYLQKNYANWFNKVVDNYQKSKLFLIEDTAVIPLDTMMDDDYFG